MTDVFVYSFIFISRRKVYISNYINCYKNTDSSLYKKRNKKMVNLKYLYFSKTFKMRYFILIFQHSELLTFSLYLKYLYFWVRKLHQEHFNYVYLRISQFEPCDLFWYIPHIKLNGSIFHGFLMVFNEI